MSESIPMIPKSGAAPMDLPRGTARMNENGSVEDRHRRLLVFLGLFLFMTALGAAYNFLRPSLYQAVAVLWLKPPESSNAAGLQGGGLNTADKSELVVAQQVLTNHSLLEQLQNKLENDPSRIPSGNSISLDTIQRMIRVELVPEGNLIRLHVEGPDREGALRTLETWISEYLTTFEESQRRALAATKESLDQSIGALEDRLELKRKELEVFRKLNDIISLQREENQLVSRLRGLNDSLTRARERLTHARARLQSLEEARARGEDLLEGRELQLVTALEQKAENLRDQLHDLGQRYTERYMALDPKIRNLRSQLERTEEKIRVTRVQAQAAVVDAARQEVVGAQRALEDLEEQAKQFKDKIQDFNEKFARHEALVEEVKSLESLVRSRAQNRMHKEVAPEEAIPKLSLLESPTVSERPVRPHYLRDMGIVAAGAVLLSLMGVWLVEFLQRSPEKKPPAQSTTLIFQPNVLPGPKSAHNPLPTLSHVAEPRPVWRELSPLEIRAMAQKATPQDALILGLLLSGVQEHELERLRWDHVDTRRGLLTVPGTFGRPVALPGVCLRALEAMLKTDQTLTPEVSSTDQSRQGPLFVDAHGSPLGIGEMRKRLTCLAQEAGLAAPAEVTPEVLRYTFLMFLVRQGIRLGALESVAGEIPDVMYAHYGAYAPPGPGKDPQAISRIMPVLD